MSARSLLFSIAVSAFIVWVVIPSREDAMAVTKSKAGAATSGKAAPYQREMDKARGLGDQLQQDLDERMRGK